MIKDYQWKRKWAGVLSEISIERKEVFSIFLFHSSNLFKKFAMTAAALPVKIDLGDQEDDKNGILADDISMNPCEKPDSYFRTLFGKVHVEIAAQCIAIGSLIFQIVFHYNFHMDPSEPNLGKVIPEPFLYYTNISVLVCVLVAKNKRIAMLYWPFLAYYALIGATCAAVLGHGAFKIYCELSGSCSGLYWTRTVTNAIVIVSILVGELLLVCWMEMVVYKAYKYMIYSRIGNTAKNQYQSNIIKQNQMFTQVPMKI